MFENIKQLETFFNERKELGIKPGLDRIKQLLAFMDHPEQKLRAIHVAGTNGKGSTISFLKQALMQNNYKVGTFISPSLDGLTGHIFCNDEKITNKQLITLMNRLYPVITQLDESGHHPTEFEVLTVLAFMYFSEHVDISLIETGMGGSEDTTNCFKPILSIITNVDLDHTSFLGETTEKIAAHKAGIIKHEIPVIIGDVTDSVYKVLQYEAQSKQAPIYRLFDDFTYTSIKQTDQGQSFKWHKGKDHHLQVNLQMCGTHQVKNSSLAIMALMYLEKQEYAIDEERAVLGLKETIVPGRFEVVHKNPQIILDGAHNQASVQSFIETMLLTNQSTHKHLVFAAFKDKALKQMLAQLMPYFTTITLTSFDHPRASSAKGLYESMENEHLNTYIEHDWKAVMHQISQQDINASTDYYVTGSLHFIGEVRRFFTK